MYTYKLNAINFLYYFKEAIFLEEEDQLFVDETIDFLRKDRIYHSDIAPYFQLTISKEQNIFYYLTFHDEGFKFSNYLAYNELYHSPIDIRVAYKKGLEEEPEGSVREWVENAQSLLKNYDTSYFSDRATHSAVKIAFDTSF